MTTSGQHNSDQISTGNLAANLLFPESSSMFRRLIESVHVGVYIADKDGNLVYANGAMTEILGYTHKDEIIGRNLAKDFYVVPEERAEFLKSMEVKGFVRDYEVRNKKKDGSTVVLSVTSQFIRNDINVVLGVEGVVVDITERKKLQEALVTEKKKFEQVLGFDETVGAIRKFDTLIDFIVEKTASILDAEKCSIMLLDNTRQELVVQASKGLKEEFVKDARFKVGLPVAGIVVSQKQPILVKDIEQDDRFARPNRPDYVGRSFIIAPIILQDKVIGVINVSDKSKGSHHPEDFDETDLKILNSIAREVAVAIDNVKLFQELNFLAITDPLTHIHNYRHFNKSLEYEIKRSKRSKTPMSVVMIDVDDFKSYNDAFGHVEGDNLLKGIGDVLKKVLRETDVICRYAGDEFSVILPDTPIDGAVTTAERIRKAVEQASFKRKVTISLGLAQLAKNNSSTDIVQKADHALYTSKHQGKNRVSTSK